LLFWNLFAFGEIVGNVSKAKLNCRVVFARHRAFKRFIVRHVAIGHGR